MSDNKYPYMTDVMTELMQRAKCLGYEVTVESSTGMVMTIKKHSLFRVIMGADLGLNFSAANRLCNDKYFAANILHQAGLNVVESQILNVSNFSVLDDVTFPCIVKPNKGSGGDGFSSVNSIDEVISAVEFAKNFDSQVLIQHRHIMREFRIVVLDGKLLYGYEKTAWQLHGDGRTSIAHFISRYNDQVSERNEVSLNDTALNMRLMNTGKTLSTVLASGEVYDLFTNANLKKGASTFHVEYFAPEYVEVVVKACSAIGIRYGGVDLFATQPEVFDDQYRLIEVNANPGFEFLRGNPEMMMSALDSLASAIFNCKTR